MTEWCDLLDVVTEQDGRSGRTRGGRIRQRHDGAGQGERVNHYTCVCACVCVNIEQWNRCARDTFNVHYSLHLHSFNR